MTLALGGRLPRLGLTEGQRWTIGIGLVVGLGTAAIGIPPTLRDRPLRHAAPAAAEPAPAQASPPPVAAAPVEVPTMAPPVTAAPFVASPPIDTYVPPEEPAAAYADGGSAGHVERVAAVAAPAGIAVDAATGTAYITTGTGKVVRLAASGAVEREYVLGGRVTGIVLDGDDHAIVLDAASAQVLRLDLRTGAEDELAAIPDVPACTTDQGRCELSVANAEPVPQAVALDLAGSLYVADGGQGIVWRVDRSGGVTLWDRAPEYLAADGAGPAGIAVTGSDVLVAVRRSVVALTGAVFRVPIGTDGTAGARQEIFRSKPDEAPAGIAVGASGRTYVTLSGAGAVVVLDRDGTTVATFTEPALAGPAGLAFRGRSLLVANQAGGSIVRVATDE